MRNRKRIRLRGYDYSLTGAYCITICTKDRTRTFGEIIDGVMYSNDNGKKAEKYWHKLPRHFHNVAMDEFVIMPDHVHGIIIINDDCRGLINQIPTEKSWIMMKNPKTILGKIIRYYKARTCQIIHVMGVDSFEWQRSYYDRVIRNEPSLNRIREYIRTNPERWISHKENPTCKSVDNFDRWLTEEGNINMPKRKK